MQAYRRIVPYVSFLGLLVIPVQAQIRVEDLLLTAAEIAPSCEIISGDHPVRNEDQVFYDHGVHSELLPLVFNKRTESFRCGHEKGTLYYFEYTDAAQREKAEVYARTTLWGVDAKSSDKHQEQIFHSSRFLMILSFKDPQPQLLTALLMRIKRSEAASPSSKTP